MIRDPSSARRSEALTWSIRGAYLVGWAAVGIFLWIPWLLGAVARRALTHTRFIRSRPGAPKAGDRPGGAAGFYRAFVRAMEAVEGVPASPTPLPSRRQPRQEARAPLARSPGSRVP